jgi:phytoene synthase
MKSTVARRRVALRVWLTKMAGVSESFDAARAICKRHARTFYFASVFLPRPKREAAYAVYAFCRLLDDAADTGGDLFIYDRALDAAYAGGSAEVGSELERRALVAFGETVRRYDIPKRYFDDLAAGCRMDLTVNRYATWDDLRGYCYHVAGVVGLIMCRIFGLAEPAAQRRAVVMGEAMQLTNILRDVGEDRSLGRIYLPGEDLTRFGYTETDLMAGLVNEPFRQLMRFEVDRARSLYRDGAAGLVALPDDGSRFTASAMGVIYAGILGAIERQRYDVFARRARLTTVQKLLRLPAARRVARRAAGDPVPDVF